MLDEFNEIDDDFKELLDELRSGQPNNEQLDGENLRNIPSELPPLSGRLPEGVSFDVLEAPTNALGAQLSLGEVSSAIMLSSEGAHSWKEEYQLAAVSNDDGPNLDIDINFVIDGELPIDYEDIQLNSFDRPEPALFQLSDRLNGGENVLKTRFSRTQLKEQKQRIDDFPLSFCDAFNVGDMERLKALVDEAATERCIFKSPASDSEIEGCDNIYEFYRGLFNDYLDGVFIRKDCNWVNREEFQFRCYFRGTQIDPKLKDSSYSKNSVTHHLNLSKLTAEGILDIARREKECCETKMPIRIFVKADTKLYLNRSYQVKKWTIEYLITSFEEAPEEKIKQEQEGGDEDSPAADVIDVADAPVVSAAGTEHLYDVAASTRT
jgi:hypothetical protein